MTFYQEIVSEILHLDVERPALRKFGHVVGLVTGGIAAYRIFHAPHHWTTLTWVLLILSATLLVFGTFLPIVLRPIYRVWMGLAFVMGAIMSRVILMVVFFLTVTPIGWLLRITGKDLLRKKKDPAASTYWEPKVYRDDTPKRLERYF